MNKQSHEIYFDDVCNPCLVQWVDDTEHQPSPSVVKSWQYLSIEQMELLKTFSGLGEMARAKVLNFAEEIRHEEEL